MDEGYDQDGDTKADCFDNCLNTANADQADADQDGVGDACDAQSLPVPVDAVDIAKLKVRFKKTTGTDEITLKGTFTLGAQSGGIYPPAERLTFTLADVNGDVFNQTLRAGALLDNRASGLVDIRFSTEATRLVTGGAGAMTTMSSSPCDRGQPGRKRSSRRQRSSPPTVRRASSAASWASSLRA